MQRGELLTAFAAPAGAKFGAQDIVLRDRLGGKRRGQADQGQDITHHDANIGSMARSEITIQRSHAEVSLEVAALPRHI
ncbi:hypothetical protein ACFSHQ_20595 [Gemmobacter lanyuensis]